MADKQVKVEVVTEKNLAGVEAIEAEVRKLQQQKLQLNIEANTSRLDEVNSKIEAAKSKLSELKGKADVDDSDIKKVEEEQMIKDAMNGETSEIDAEGNPKGDIVAIEIDPETGEITQLDPNTIPELMEQTEN